MPYTNVPDELQDKMESCVMQVMDKGNDKETAIAMCYAAVVEGKADALEAVKSAGFVLDMPAAAHAAKFSIKAVGDWELDVLAIPFDTVDRDRQWFDAKTEIMPDTFETPAVMYQHTIDAGAKDMQGQPAPIGKTVRGSLEKKSDGWHIRVILDKANALAKRVMEAARRGLVAVSSGTIGHIARLEVGGKMLPYKKDKPGRIAVWPFAEISLWDMGGGNYPPANRTAYALPAMKALYDAAGMELPKNIPPDEGDGDTANGQAAGKAANPGDAAKPTTIPQGEIAMDEIETKVDAAVKAALDKVAAEAATRKAEEERIAAEAEKRANEKLDAYKAEAAKNRRLPETAPYATKYADLNAYDNLDPADTAVLVGVLNSQKNGVKASPAAHKALAIKLEEDKTEVGEVGMRALKAAGFAGKANEMDYSTYSSYGDEWVGIAYSQTIWEAIRLNTWVLGKLPQIEVPQGMESIYLPLESTDPTWYKVAEATSSATAYSGPTPTVTASLLGTGRVQLTLAKLGARVVWSGELDEGSLIPFAPQLRAQMVASGADYLESALIDGDTVTTASTNINDIDGTPTATDWFLVWDGFRKSCILTTSANSRSASGSLDITDYLETVKLMGTGGKNGVDRQKVGFIVDVPTYYKTMQLPEVLTRDVFVSPTLEGGQLTGLWGYQLGYSANICKNGSAGGLSEATGKVDETSTDNTYGQILAVRWDQWKFGWRRRMTMETTRFAASDTTEIVAQMRCGLIQRDTEASAITYCVGV